MAKRMFSLLLTLCLIVGLLPAVAIPHAHAEVTSATVTLWGTSVTVDTNDATEDIPGAYYWVNGEGTAVPVEATEDQIAAGGWNYSLSIIEGVPTLALKAATYKGTVTFLDTTSTYSGKFKIVYEGTNTISAPNVASTYGLRLRGATQKAQFEIVALQDDAVFTVNGGNANTNIFVVEGKNSLTFDGGTVNLYRSRNTKLGVLAAAYSPVTIKNCTFNATNDYANTYTCNPLVQIGGLAAGDSAIINSKVTIKGKNKIGLAVGVWQSADNSVVYESDLVVDGNSQVYIEMNQRDDKVEGAWNGAFYGNLVMKSGSFEAKDRVQALNFIFRKESGKANTATKEIATEPDMTKYDGYYNMYITEGGEPVSEYAPSTYFKVEACDHSAVEGVEEITQAATCTATGVKTITYTCSYGHTWVETEEIAVVPHTPAEAVPDSATGEFVTKCANCGVEMDRVACEHATTETSISGTNFVTKCTACGATVKTEAAPALETAYTMTIHGSEYKLTNYDIPIYLVQKNTTAYYWATVEEEVEVTDPETGEVTTEIQKVTKAVVGEYITQTKTGANEENYNAKLIWHSGDEAPTLYLRDFVIDAYDNELGKWRNNGSSKSNVYTTAAIHTGSTAPLTIKVDGTCELQTYEGIHYQNELTIEGADDEAKLTIYTNRTGILPSVLGNGYAANPANIISGYKLILDVNLDITQTTWSNLDYGYAIRTVGADMIINGGKITTKITISEKTACGIAVLESGNLYVNGGHVYSESYHTANLTGAAYVIEGDVYVTGGKLEAYSAYQSGVRAENVYITGGEVETNTSYAGILIRSKTGELSITDGVVKCFTRAGTIYPFAHNTSASGGLEQRIPTLGAGAIVTAGAKEASATVVKKPASFDYLQHYIYIEFGEVPVCDHTNTTENEEIITNATCDTAGSKKVTVTCECGEVISEEIVTIEATGHVNKDTKTELIEAATCGKDGSEYVIICCLDCGAELERTVSEIEATGLHTEGEWESGTKHCVVCGIWLKDCNHDYVGEQTKAPTCNEQGEMTYTCSICGKGYVESIDPTWQHTPEEDDGDCTTPRYCVVCNTLLEGGRADHFGGQASCHEKAKCEICGKEYGEKLEHQPAYNPEDCTKDVLCGLCGDLYAKGAESHSWGEYDPEGNRQCMNCMATEKCAHEKTTTFGYQAPTCNMEGWTGDVVCDTCMKYISYSESIPATGAHIEAVMPGYPADCESAGMTDGKYCEACGTTLENQQTIPAKGHTQAAPVEENKVDSDLNNEGKYDSVVYCSVCEKELSRTTVTIPVKAGAKAEANGVKYYTLAEAVAAGGEVKLLADIDVTATIKILAGNTVVLDLNGYVIDGVDVVRIAIMSYGDLTLKDSVGGGEIKAGIGAAGNAVNICAGTFVMESGSIYSRNNALLIDEEAATIIINGGTITAEPTTSNSAVMYISSKAATDVTINGGTMVGFNGILLWNNTTIDMVAGTIDAQGRLGIQGNGSNDNTEINISGGSVSGLEAAIYHPQGGVLNISGTATLTGATGVIVKGGEINISGGTIAATGAAVEYTPKNSGFVGTGDGLYVEHYDNSANSENYGTPVVSVTGGTITSVNGKAVGNYANPNTGVEALTGYVSGGTFSSALEEELCAEGYVPVANEDGTFGVIEATYIAEANGVKYTTLAEAVAAGGEVKLLTDVVLESGIVIESGKVVTIDLAGFDITMTVESVSKNTYLFDNKGTLTITDSVGDGEVCLTYTGARTGSYTISTIGNSGVLNIQGGTINCVPGSQYISYAIDATSGGTVNISGGEVIGGASNYSIRVFLWSDTWDNTLNVTGGTVWYVWVQNSNVNANKATVNINGGTVYYVYISAANGSACDVSNITLNAKADLMPYGVTVVSNSEEYFLENVDGIYQIGSHTCSFVPEIFPATCTEDGKVVYTCTCGETYEEIIPATGHTYDDAADGNCNVCGAGRATITVEGNKVTVHVNGVTNVQTHTFYVEGKDVADINSWSDLKATGTLKSYKTNEFVLEKNGAYVLRLEYIDTLGVRQTVSYPVEIDYNVVASCVPEFTIEDNIVSVIANGATSVKVHAFYVEGKNVTDITNWSQLKAADPEFQSFSKSIFALTKVGKYVLRAEYVDTDGVKHTKSFEITIDIVPVSLTVEDDVVTVNVDQAANVSNVKVYAFYVEGKSVSNIHDWYELKTVDPNFVTYTRSSFVLSRAGKYVLRVQYTKADGTQKAISYMATTTILTPEVINVGEKVAIYTHGFTVTKVHVFDVEGKDIADINDWNELMAEANSYVAHSKTQFVLTEAGDYVVRVVYIDAKGIERKASFKITMKGDENAVKPEIVNVGNKVAVYTNGLTVSKVHVFNVEGKNIADINNWDELNAKANSYVAYDKTQFVLAEAGEYVVRVVYKDAKGVERKISQKIAIAGETTVATPEIVYVDNKVTIDTHGMTIDRVYVYNVDGKDIADISDLNELKAEANSCVEYTKGQFTLTQNGDYVIRVVYTDEDGVERRFFQALTIGEQEAPEEEDSVKPELIVMNNRVAIYTHGLAVSKVYAFNVEGKEIADISNLDELKAQANSYSEYTKTQFVVAEAGEYVVRVEYVDENGVEKVISQKIDIQF